MGRPSQIGEKRDELLPLVANTFADLGYRRTTTAELASRCGVQENILYRIWPDKKAMFIAAIEYIYDLSKVTWAKLVLDAGDKSSAERLLEYESKHIGEYGHVRIIFAGLSETDDPEIRRALSQMYRRFQEFIAGQVKAFRHAHGSANHSDPGLAAWGIIGIGKVAMIARELKLLDSKSRSRLIIELGQVLLAQPVLCD